MARVLIATPEPIGRRLAGPAIRAAQLARVIGSAHEVVLASLGGTSVSPIDGRPVLGAEAITPVGFDAAIVQGSVTVRHPELVESSLPLVVDWFDPFHLEALHRSVNDRIRRIDLVEGARQTLEAQARRGDFFLCSNAAQRHHWLGWLAAAGRLNDVNHDDDPTFDSLIAVAAFGVDALKAPERNRIRDTFSVIGPDDPILLWAGGLHDWLDPVTLVRAMPQALDQNPDTRLVFLAGPHPNTSIETMGIRGDAIDAARELRLFAKNVLFVNQWVDYEDRLNWVADATIGVVTHHEHLETQHAHRTRLLDHLAAGLPTISTGGDPASQLLEAAGAARTVPAGDIHTLGEALAGLLGDSPARERMGAAATSLGETLRWEHTTAPLLGWLENPRAAADRRGNVQTGFDGGASSGGSVERLVSRARLHLDDGGPRQVLARALGAGRRRLGR
jgi:glycosyltransferase involved in cell wall biosynthesis